MITNSRQEVHARTLTSVCKSGILLSKVFILKRRGLLRFWRNLRHKRMPGYITGNDGYDNDSGVNLVSKVGACERSARANKET